MADGGRIKVNTPQVNTPQVNSPQVNSPQVNSPQVNSPQVNSPQVNTPQVNSPQVNSPQVNSPQVNTPQVNTPQVNSPQGNSPQVNSPQVNSPQGPRRVFNPRLQLCPCSWLFQSRVPPPSPLLTTPSLSLSLSTPPFFRCGPLFAPLPWRNRQVLVARQPPS
ncbi:Neurofilament medium polypeptide [Liparis tanakae]|uniref:Neurofilament medium polypeptide n=1 Tax=Liparis tanakae TaxID=230148 RepID=A0A4Z2IKN7_9TELE|nr:Neurofilament medium polypeptide [Liparis tanakae]